MSTHQRTIIRDALLALIKGVSPTHPTAAGANVFSNRLYNIPNSKLPAINITYGEESATLQNLNSTRATRKLIANIEVRVEANNAVDDVADSICEEIESIINSNRQISGTATSIIYLGVSPELNVESEKPLGIFTMNYEITYLK